MLPPAPPPLPITEYTEQSRARHVAVIEHSKTVFQISPSCKGPRLEWARIAESQDSHKWMDRSPLPQVFGAKGGPSHQSVRCRPQPSASFLALCPAQQDLQEKAATMNLAQPTASTAMAQGWGRTQDLEPKLG